MADRCYVGIDLGAESERVIAGLPGVFVAAPFTVVLMVLAKMPYVEDALGDRSMPVPASLRRARPGDV